MRRVFEALVGATWRLHRTGSQAALRGSVDYSVDQKAAKRDVEMINGLFLSFSVSSKASFSSRLVDLPEASI